VSSVSATASYELLVPNLALVEKVATRWDGGGPVKNICPAIAMTRRTGAEEHLLEKDWCMKNTAPACANELLQTAVAQTTEIVSVQ
jgi:hypothetical protein